MLASVFEEADDVGEAVGATVVGVGDFAVGVVLDVAAHGHDAGVVFAAAGEGEDVAEVGVVHGDDEVEGFEVASGELAAEVASPGVAFMFEGGEHAAVGFVADVIVGGGGGVGLDFLFESGFADEAVEDDFRGGRAADVAEADEEDAVRGRVFRCGGGVCGGLVHGLLKHGGRSVGKSKGCSCVAEVRFWLWSGAFADAGCRGGRRMAARKRRTAGMTVRLCG